MSDVDSLNFTVKVTALRAFLKLEAVEKVHVIELGMQFFTAGNQKQQCWNNEEWTRKLEAEKKKFYEKIMAKNQEIKLERNKSDCIIEQHKSELTTLTLQIKEQSKALYINRIQDLRNELERKDKKIQISNEENRRLYKQAYDEFEEKLNDRELRYESKINKITEDYEKKLAIEKNEKITLISQNQNSTIKGQIGEQFLLNQLNMLFPTAEIEDTHKQKCRGDFIFKENAFTMLIETKNYAKNVTKPEIDKFYRDIDQSQDIHCGILISLHSGICARPDFHLEVRDGKPILFLHNVQENIRNIELAITFFKLILKTDSIDLSCKDVVEKLRNIIPVVKRNSKKMRQNIDKYQREMLECIAEQETYFRTLFELMNLKY